MVCATSPCETLHLIYCVGFRRSTPVSNPGHGGIEEKEKYLVVCLCWSMAGHLSCKFLCKHRQDVIGEHFGFQETNPEI